MCACAAGGSHLALGVGEGGEGWLQLLDALSGFAPATGTPTVNGWRQVPWAIYNEAVGSTRPACRNTDGDPQDEMLVGLSGFSPLGDSMGPLPLYGGWLVLYDDLPAGLSLLGWPRIDWPYYNERLGSTVPAQ